MAAARFSKNILDYRRVHWVHSQMAFPMTAPRRRWSFSLRALFILVTICAVASPVAVPFLVAKYKEWTAPKIRLVPSDEDPFVSDLPSDYDRQSTREQRSPTPP